MLGYCTNEENDATDMLTDVMDNLDSEVTLEENINNILDRVMDKGGLEDLLVLFMLLILNSSHEIDLKKIKKTLQSFYDISFIEKKPKLEDEAPQNPQTLELAMQVMAFTGQSLEICQKAVEVSNHDINTACNIVMDDPARILKTIEKERREKEIREQKEAESMAKRQEAVDAAKVNHIDMQIRYTLLENPDFFIDISSIPSSADTITCLDLFTLVLSKLDILLVEMDSELLLDDANTHICVDMKSLSICLLTHLVKKFLSDESDDMSESLRSFSTAVLFKLLSYNIVGLSSNSIINFFVNV